MKIQPVSYHEGHIRQQARLLEVWFYFGKNNGFGNIATEHFAEQSDKVHKSVGFFFLKKKKKKVLLKLLLTELILTAPRSLCFMGAVLIHMWDENPVHVLVQLSGRVGSSDLLERPAVNNHNVTLLARVGVDDG